MKRIVFLDYVRVFACFLVMVVHASENFYGAPGSTDMVGPQAFRQMSQTGYGCPYTMGFRVWPCRCL